MESSSRVVTGSGYQTTDLLANGDAEIEWSADFTEPLENVQEAFERARDDDDAIKGMISIGE